ncbi:MAG: hypothetical protein QNI91_17945 [Arenicellales bacterium]|nr:hypothetical protein [Arenicellales bacterium]
MRLKASALVLFLMLGLSGMPIAGAHTFIYNLVDGTPVFSVDFPDGWRLDLDFDPPAEGIDAPPPPRVVEAIPKDGAKLWLGTWVVTEITDINDADAYFGSLEQYILSDVTIDSKSQNDHNGMAARVLKGSAKKDTEPVEWAVALFQPHPEIVAAILYIGVTVAREHRAVELQAIVDSVRPVN